MMPMIIGTGLGTVFIILLIVAIPVIIIALLVKIARNTSPKDKS